MLVRCPSVIEVRICASWGPGVASHPTVQRSMVFSSYFEIEIIIDLNDFDDHLNNREEF